MAAVVEGAQVKGAKRVDVEYCHIDIETFSACELKKEGTYRYAAHPTTEIMVVCYRFGHNGPVHVWIPECPTLDTSGLDFELTLDRFPPEALPLKSEMDKGAKLHIQRQCPDDLSAWVASGGQMRAWNALFERTLLSGPAGQKIGFPPTPLEQWMCSMAKAAAHSLPQALGHCAHACGTHAKDSAGHHEMLQLAKPRKPSKNDPDERWYIDKYPVKYRVLYHYCMDDVRAESALDAYIPEMSPGEVRAYHLDQRINDRGIQVDLEKVEDAIALIEEAKARLVAKCVEWTGLRPSQTAKLADWVRDNGYDIENLQAPTIKEAVADPECPADVSRVLRLYTLHNMKAVTKYPAMLRAACEDGRLRGMFVYHGASTGRWSSRIVQLQNLFRPIIKDCDTAIDMMELRDLDYFRGMFTNVLTKKDANPMHVFASCIRGMLTPAEEKLLLCLDFSQIEARVIAWLAGEQDTLDVFASGLDVYKHAAAGIYNVPYEDVTDEQRFIGKIAILALGYQGGRKAFAKMAKNYGVEIDEALAEQIKVDWRGANPKVVGLWYKLEELASAAIANPGKIYATRDKRIMFKVEGDFLYMRLPSGRRLAYFKPRLDGEGKPTYMGIDTYTRQWCRCKTYGGKLVENAVQAIARDLLLFAMFALEDTGEFPIIGTVHDEEISEIDWIPEEERPAKLAEASAIMCTKPGWADGLPVEADGFIALRYRK